MKISKRLMVAAVVLLLAVGTPALAADWPMFLRDQHHTGSVPDGPQAPLKMAWSASAEGPNTNGTAWPVVFDSTVYVSSGPGVLAVDAQTGERRWLALPPEGQKVVGLAVDETGVYISIPGDQILALDRLTGEELWRFQAASSIESAPTLADGRLYFGSQRARTFYCVDVATGQLVWEARLDEDPHTAPVISDGLAIFSTRVIGSPSSSLVALNAVNGNEVWRAPLHELGSAPAVLDGKVVIGVYDFTVRAFDLRNGDEVWRTQVEDAFGYESGPAVAFGDVFIADRVGNFYRLDGETGERKWIFTDTLGTFNQSYPVIAGKTMFIGGGAGWLHAINVDSGKQLWKEQVGGFVMSGAADSERFYFGVKFRNEGLYAYEHDPDGELDSRSVNAGPTPREFIGNLASIRTEIALLLLAAGVFVAVVKLRARRTPSSGP